LTFSFFFVYLVMEKGELQRMCDKLFEQFESCKTFSIDHLHRLKSFEIEKDVFIKKIKSLEDALMHSKLPLEKPCDSVMSNDDVTSSSHAIPIHRTMFVKPSMSTHHPHTSSANKRYNSIPICHYCGISGHIRPNCFQLRSQKPWDKIPGIKNQVMNLCDQVKLISKKLESPTPYEKNLVMPKKNISNKQVWIKESENLCFVAHTTLKILDTCLWYLDSTCSKHMTGQGTP
jgi:hypothetical protein